MAKKEKYKPFVLPSDFKELELYVQSHKTDLTERVISSIEFALEKNLPMVEVFNFKNSDFVITISREAFRDNIQNAYNFYLIWALIGFVFEDIDNGVFDEQKRIMCVVKNRGKDSAFNGKCFLDIKELMPFDPECAFVEVFFALNIEFVYFD